LCSNQNTQVIWKEGSIKFMFATILILSSLKFIAW
jgi:hypothetical protein